jgi:transcriptional regulator with XRE-family HTH domain
MFDMYIMEGFTINEMAERLGISPNTVKQRLFQRGVKPICKAALYDMSALGLISDFGPKGFQPKTSPTGTDTSDDPPK